MVFRRSLKDSKTTQVSRTFLSILADLNSAVVRIVSTLPLISDSSSLFSKRLGTVPSTPTTTGIIVTMFRSFLSSLARSKYLSIFTFSIVFTLCSNRKAKSTRWQVLFFLLRRSLTFWTRLGDPFVFQSLWEIYKSNFLWWILVVLTPFDSVVKS